MLRGRSAPLLGRPRRLAGRHEPDLDLETILDHLAGVGVFPDEDFAEYELGEAQIADLRTVGVTSMVMTSLGVARSPSRPREPGVAGEFPEDGTLRPPVALRTVTE